MKKKAVVGILKAIATLPLGCLYVFSDVIYLILYYIIRYRRKVVRRNLIEAFPEKDSAEIISLEKEYYRHLGDLLVETIKLLNISSSELKRRVEVVNIEIVNSCAARGDSVALLLGHYGNWEWVQEIRKYFTGSSYPVSIYHPLKNKFWDTVYKEIRSRWNVDIIPQRRAVRTLLDRDNRPWICGFIADNRPDTFTPDNIVPFLNHNTSFIYGPEVIGDKVGARFFYLEMEKLKRGYYRITFHPLEREKSDPYPKMRAFWHEFEKTIKKKPAYWLWSHKRWKRDTLINSDYSGVGIR